MPELKAIKEKHNGKKNDQPPRASMTDAEARKMKMPDGGFRPAYNVQLAADTEQPRDRRRGREQPGHRPVAEPSRCASRWSAARAERSRST